LGKQPKYLLGRMVLKGTQKVRVSSDKETYSDKYTRTILSSCVFETEFRKLMLTGKARNSMLPGRAREISKW